MWRESYINNKQYNYNQRKYVFIDLDAIIMRTLENTQFLHVDE